MLRIRDYPISKKLTWMNVLVSGAALLLACSAFVAYDRIAFRETLVRSLSTQAQIVGFNGVAALEFNDPQSAENTLSALKAAPNIVSASIVAVDGRPFAAYRRERGEQILTPLSIPVGQTEAHELKDGQILLAHSIVFRGKPAGTVYIRSDLREMDDRLKRYAVIAALVMLTSLTAALFVSSIFKRAVAQPIVQLADLARIVSRDKNYSIRAAPSGNRDELAILIGAFNEMLTQIQGRDAALQVVHNELEQRVQERTAQLSDANKELEAFTYSVSHDLRAPLRHVDGFSRLLLEEHADRLDAEGKRMLERVREGTQHMGALVDDLLNLSRVSRREVNPLVTDLNTIVGEVVTELKPTCQGREVEFRVGRLAFAQCDPGLIRQVFTNLLSNAIKFTRPRKQAVIEIGQTEHEGHSTVFVRDNGVGFSMKYADKLFGVFQRLHRAEDFEGTGVGLVTVQRIIQKHGGRVWVEAEIDKGATFYFTVEGLEEELPVGAEVAKGRRSTDR